MEDGAQVIHIGMLLKVVISFCYIVEYDSGITNNYLIELVFNNDRRTG